MQENLMLLSRKCKNKKVVFYCIAHDFIEIEEKFNLKDFFNIVALCDIKFENENYKEYFCTHPKDLKNIEFDYLIIVSPNFDLRKKYLIENKFVKKNVKIINFFQKKEKINVKKNYKQIETKLKSKEKIRILFICEENEKWCYTDLYKKLQKIEKFEVLPIALFPIISKGKIIHTQEKNKLFFENLNINSKDCWDYENKKAINIENFNPDIVFYQQPWYLNNSNNPKIVSKYALTIMAPYGYTTLGYKNWGSDSVKEIYRNLWLFLAESPYHVKFYKKTAKMKDNLVSFGSLKFDNYIDNFTTINKKPTIIYAPHHSLGDDGLKMSTFQNIYKEIFEYAKNNPQYNFIFKPHPMLAQAVVEYNLMSDKEYDNYVSSWNKLENSTVINDGNYFEIFKNSNLMITDCSSFLAEYYPTKKPIIFLNRKDRAPFDEFGNKIKKGFYEVWNFEELTKTIEKVFSNDILFKEREKILKKYFYLDKKPTADKLIEKLLKTFNF